MSGGSIRTAADPLASPAFLERVGVVVDLVVDLVVNLVVKQGVVVREFGK